MKDKSASEKFREATHRFYTEHEPIPQEFHLYRDTREPQKRSIDEKIADFWRDIDVILHGAYDGYCIKCGATLHDGWGED